MTKGQKDKQTTGQTNKSTKGQNDKGKTLFYNLRLKIPLKCCVASQGHVRSCFLENQFLRFKKNLAERFLQYGTLRYGFNKMLPEILFILSPDIRKII